jgi:aminopeptidase
MIINDEDLAAYAERIIVNGVAAQAGDVIRIAAEVCHREFSFKLAEKAYQRGAKAVLLELDEPRLTRLHINHSSDEGLTYVPKYVRAKFDEIVEDRIANIRILGPEYPTLLEDVDAIRRNKRRYALYMAQKRFYDDGVGKSLAPWCVVAAPTMAWSARVYPELEAEASYAKLWEDIFHFSRIRESWEHHDLMLHKRASRLNSANIRELHFIGSDTDLKVYLSSEAIFKGGSEQAADGRLYSPNIPTEEVFTTPDCRLTSGRVKVTRPFFVNGSLIKDLRLIFCNGKIVEFSCSSGYETFKHYLESDEGACFLGEVALVGTDSPIYQTSRVFEEILLDENAACHVAIGSAYKFCIKGGNTLDKSELIRLGVNESSVHTDMMISDDSVSVIAKTSDGTLIPLIQNGVWEKDWH